jgi:hypothetical protein
LTLVWIWFVLEENILSLRYITNLQAHAHSKKILFFISVGIAENWSWIIIVLVFFNNFINSMNKAWLLILFSHKCSSNGSY